VVDDGVVEFRDIPSAPVDAAPIYILRMVDVAKDCMKNLKPKGNCSLFTVSANEATSNSFPAAKRIGCFSLFYPNPLGRAPIQPPRGTPLHGSTARCGYE